MSPRRSSKPEAPAQESVKEQRYTGPWYRIEANALHSKGYGGRIDLGTYTEPERKKGVVTDRIADLKQQGYQEIDVVEVSSRAD